MKQIILVALLITTCSAASQATERTVEFMSGDAKIVGILSMPAGHSRPPAVLMLHGFTGQKNEFTIAGVDTGIYAYVSRKLADAGIASLRIDFAGSGESSGDWAMTTFTSQIADATRAFDFLKALPEVDGTRVGILGYSQGGLVGAHVAAARSEASAVVLWAPVTNPIATYSKIMGADTVLYALAAPKHERITADLSWGGQTTLAAAFFHEFPTVSTGGAIASYHGPLRVIVGTKETIVAPQPLAGQQLLRYHRGHEDLVTVETDHDFGAQESVAKVDEILVPKTLEWFEGAFD